MSARGVVERHRLGHPDRRLRWPDAGRSSVADAAHRGVANGKLMSPERRTLGPRVRGEPGVAAMAAMAHMTDRPSYGGRRRGWRRLVVNAIDNADATPRHAMDTGLAGKRSNANLT
jgi:hypothetical protein